jgi:uncharacterized membrane protein
VGIVGLVVIVLGVVLIVVGVQRARGPYQRLQALKEQDANIARYEAWRGGPRPDTKTGASVAMDVLKRQVQVAGLLVIAGFVVVAIGFVIG